MTVGEAISPGLRKAPRWHHLARRSDSPGWRQGAGRRSRSWRRRATWGTAQTRKAELGSAIAGCPSGVFKLEPLHRYGADRLRAGREFV